MFWFSRISGSGNFWADVLGPSLVTSFGIGPLLVPIAGAATAGVAPSEAGMASGLLNSARQIGGSIGLAAMSAIAPASTDSAPVSDSLDERLTAGYGMVFAANGALLLFAVLVAVFVLPRRSPEQGVGQGPAARQEAGAQRPRGVDADRVPLDHDRPDIVSGEGSPAERGRRG
ncbi:hypothetical protein [Streptomyces xantholiticus]|uniref:hypothetical protein n=1 Tax=Streptomyces xantholiticus TaxID=68285 RepID=UPI001672FB92|nr:hypothetical protein [Streptomyces xantholiticus]